MRARLSDELKRVLEVCKKVAAKSTNGEFSYKWLRLAGNTFHWSKLKQLVNLGYLAVSYNGIVSRGTAWYTLV